MISGILFCVLLFGISTIIGLRYVLEDIRGLRQELKDNPRCFCPDCGADLGDFYCNRIVIKEKVMSARVKCTACGHKFIIGGWGSSIGYDHATAAFAYDEALPNLQ